MYSEITLISIAIILFSLGAIVGALIYHLIIYKFSNDIEKQLDKSIQNYENFIVRKAQDSLKEFEIIRNHFTNISNHIIKEQKIIHQSTNSISDDLDTFFKELKENQKIRVFLENEIVKLKNIINRQKKKKKNVLPI